MYTFHCLLDCPFTPHQARRYFLQSQAEKSENGEMMIDGIPLKIVAHDLQACDKYDEMRPGTDWRGKVCRIRNALKRTGLFPGLTIHLEITSEKVTVVRAITTWLTEFTFSWCIYWGSGYVWHNSGGIILGVLIASDDNSVIFTHVKAYLQQSDLDYKIYEIDYDYRH